VPLGHDAQVRSAVLDPSLVTYVPAMQVLHKEQEPVFAVVEKVPLVHAAHTRSVVAEPLASTACPAAQRDHATHAVAALSSLSHVPAGHGVFAASPPAQ
jgi:hypothetical protein